jgi:hypothetical protein
MMVFQHLVTDSSAIPNKGDSSREVSDLFSEALQQQQQQQQQWSSLSCKYQGCTILILQRTRIGRGARVQWNADEISFL